ncbi:hypothetical protein PAAG_05678 [Paracoccidioides lutzii Pb01]|uniref:Uncharacterized protein n=1 Tax=Paracoccidioides lutzii (strain ATCC MYA-826 / Pb01) TaxID=502779 RepID=C1H4I5_PARBA|nr:hypothetical protein PAAG_05678 [Paracoccidioides lutzii Pb01]EEH34630.2 hypothetical protein PAAG_05678 [Paracoccidioides lutzii Pb01]
MHGFHHSSTEQRIPGAGGVRNPHSFFPRRNLPRAEESFSFLLAYRDKVPSTYTDRQTYRPTDRQTDRQTDLQTYRPAYYLPTGSLVSPGISSGGGKQAAAQYQVANPSVRCKEGSRTFRPAKSRLLPVSAPWMYMYQPLIYTALLQLEAHTNMQVEMEMETTTIPTPSQPNLSPPAKPPNIPPPDNPQRNPATNTHTPQNPHNHPPPLPHLVVPPNQPQRIHRSHHIPARMHLIAPNPPPPIRPVNRNHLSSPRTPTLTPAPPSISIFTPLPHPLPLP